MAECQTDCRTSIWVLEQRCKARKRGLCGKGGRAQRDRTSNLAEPKPAFTIQPWIWFPPKIPLNHGVLSHGMNYAPHSHSHYHCKTYLKLDNTMFYSSTLTWTTRPEYQAASSLCLIRPEDGNYNASWNTGTTIYSRHLNSEIQNHTLDRDNRKTVTRQFAVLNWSFVRAETYPTQQ